MSVSLPQRYPFPAQPMPHWEEEWRMKPPRIEWKKKKKHIEFSVKKKKKRKKVLPDKWWSRPSLGYTGRWRHTGWSGCCRSWSPACSPSPDPLWSRSCSCRSGRSPVHEPNTSGFCFERWLQRRTQMGRREPRCVAFGWYRLAVPTTELWHSDSGVQPPLSGPLHSSMSSQTWN